MVVVMGVRSFLRSVLAPFAVGLALSGLASAQVVIREQMSLQAGTWSSQEIAGTQDDVIRGDLWPGGVRGRGRVVVKNLFSILKGEPNEVNVSFMTTGGTLYSTRLDSVTVFGRNQNQCNTSLPEDGPSGDGVRSYHNNYNNYLSFNVGSDEDIEYVKIDGHNVSYKTYRNIYAEPDFRNNWFERTMPLDGCYYDFTVDLSRDNACDCVVSSPDQTDGSFTVVWDFEADPPDSLRITTTSDTVLYSVMGPNSVKKSRIDVQSIYDDGLDAPYNETYVDYVATSSPYGSLKASYCNSYGCSEIARGDSLRIKYSSSYRVFYLADGITGDSLLSPGVGPIDDTPIEITASGSGVEGRAVVVIRGEGGSALANGLDRLQSRGEKGVRGASALPATSYSVPYGSRENGVELFADPAVDVNFSLREAPSWLSFRLNTADMRESSGSFSGVAHFTFDVNESAPIGELAEVVFDARSDGSLIATHVIWIEVEPPSELVLEVPQPNPSRGAVTVPFVIPSDGPARLAAYDVLGREVAVLADGAHEEGAHEARLPTGSLAPGVYVVRLVAGGETRVQRLTVVQ